jgi:hypothetical protein
MKNKLLFLFPFLFIGWLTVAAQWSADAMMNTQLSNMAGEQVLPKIAICTDGSYYISWFSSESANYNVRLQRLDKDGYPLWEDNGLLVSDHPQMSWLTDWSLAVDPENYALVTFQDIRNTDNNPVGYRVSPNGYMMWGEDGIMLSNLANFEPSPVVCATEAGNAVFAWSSEAVANMEVHLQKVSPTGDLLWGDGLVVAYPGVNVKFPYLFPAGDDHVYLVWHEETGPFWAPNRALYVQELDADGNFMWATDLEVYPPSPGGPVITLQMCRDNSGGIVFSWYGNDQGTHFNCWVQHMDGDGILTMPTGTLVSTSMVRNHMYPAPAFIPLTQEIVVYFSEQDLNQNQRGLYAQKFDLAGNRQWTDEGKQLIPLSNNDYSLPMAGGVNDQSICVYQAYEFGNVVDSKVQAVMLDGNGDFVWNDQFIDMSTYQSSKLHTVMAPYSFGQWVVAWEDERSTGRDIYAQNIQPDGTLGVVTTSIETPVNADQWSVAVQPNPFVNDFSFDISTLEQGAITLEIFDMTGKRMEIIHRDKQADDLSIAINGHDFPSGFYFYSIRINGQENFGKLVKQ